MKRSSLAAICLAVLFFWGGGVHAATYSGCIEGSGVLKSQARDVGPFRAIDVSGAYDVKATRGDELRLEISADDNLLPHIRTRVEDGVMVIDSDKAFCTQNRLTVNLTAPNIEKISLSGAIDLSIDGVDNAKLGIHLKGSCGVAASGKTAELVVEAAGATSIDAGNLTCKIARVKLSGASEAVVHATETLDVEISGAGELIYYGDPETVSQKISGAGEMMKKQAPARRKD